jgi:hypothetical protein
MQNETNDTQANSNEDNVDRKKMQMRIISRRNYLKNRRGVDISDMTVDEILSYRIYKIPREENMKSVYNKRYNEKAKANNYFQNYYREHIERIECPICCKTYVNQGTFNRHLRGARNIQCKIGLGLGDEVVVYEGEDVEEDENEPEDEPENNNV